MPRQNDDLCFLNARFAVHSGTLTGEYAKGAHANRARQKEPHAMMDIAWLAILAGLTLLTLGFVRLCDAS